MNDITKNDIDIFNTFNTFNKNTNKNKFEEIEKIMNNKTDDYFDYFNKKYYVHIPKYYLLNWCSLYELLINNNIKLYDNTSTSIHICSKEESSYMALDSYYYIKYKSINQPKVLNLNITQNIDTLDKIKKIFSKKINIIIFNCSKQFDFEKNITYDSCFTYVIDKNGPLYKMQFNYKNNELILTIYYKPKTIKFKSEESIKILGIDLNKEECIIERKNKEHKYKIHKKNNPLDHHMHFKIPVEKEKQFIKGVFTIYGFDKSTSDYHIDKIFNSSLKNTNKNKINEQDQEQDYYYKLQYYIGLLLTCNKGGTILYRLTYPLNKEFDYILLHILNTSFKNFTIYRPSLMFDTYTIYVVCQDYKGIDNLIITKEDIAKLFLKIKKYLPLNRLLKNYIVPVEFITYIDKIIESIDNKNKNIISNIDIKTFNIFDILKKWFIKYKIPLRNK